MDYLSKNHEGWFRGHVTKAGIQRTPLNDDVIALTLEGNPQCAAQLRDSMRDGVKAVSGKKKKALPLEDPGVLSVQFHTACATLGINGKKLGERIDPELIRTKKRELAKKFHPDATPGKREQFEAVMKAAEWLEKYNEGVKTT